ncbi:glycine cleavage system protein R [Kineobactrum salinum]|uniref:Glycine cleavage system transcriptional repressor n=1 Tax=Kineobactrum salinum TaxID=2708301 RepID=A0A6C0TX72_9GAMM|nr:ACT domain-containing protein [Kineobactrum salinum]QIB64376.1 ACT domain-containing protein [Kineobactrum salinum]
METSFIVTFIGDDRPGLVEQLSAAIERSGGNWLESQLSQLGGKFAGLVLVSLPEGTGEALEQTLKELASTGLSVRVTPTSGAAARGPAGRPIALSVLGPDRPGIVREIARALAAEQVNVIEMDSTVSSAPMSGEPLFQARIRAEIPGEASLEALTDAMDAIAELMTLEIDLEAGS